ncbi:MAG: fumarylacetoacetate hydrolase family protein [Actinobacteria bacterium]|nr:fumarylacetoacetate hydrolase family protein [Actinomycetota bacterium]
MTVADDDLRRLAMDLSEAYRTGVPIAPIRDSLADGGIEAAYRVQQLQTEQWLAAGRRVVGRKIGLTSEVVQRQLGVDQPDFGVLLADMCLTSGEAVPFGAVLQPRVEAEVALVVNRDLVEPDLTIAELLRAVEFVLPAIEVVGSRIDGWNITILDTVADNASSGMFVLGTRPVKPTDIELRDLAMELTVDGEVVSTGAGSACLGHPYRAALWLARRLASADTPLRAGDVVMTGALGPMVPLVPGAQVAASIEGLGTVRTSGATS